MHLYKGECLYTVMDRFEISTLRAYYGALITGKQNELIRLHYDEDISLGELAEMFSVSRQAVLDGIKRGERALAEFEEKLGLVARERKVASLIEEAERALGEGRTADCAASLSRAGSLLEE